MLRQEILCVCEDCKEACCSPEPWDYFVYNSNGLEAEEVERIVGEHEEAIKNLRIETAEGKPANWAESFTEKDEFSFQTCDACRTREAGARFEIYLLIDDGD